MDTRHWLVVSDRDSCIGAGVCASVVPKKFRITDGYSEPVSTRTEPDEEIVLAANLCPMSAIRVTDLTTGALIAPVDD